MGNQTGIEWTDFTSNPIRFRQKSDGKIKWACVKVSPGCAHCYAEALALRFERGRLFNDRNMQELEVFLDETELHWLLTSKKISGKKVFVADMTDLFGEWVPFDLLDKLFAVFALRSDVTFQILTKRAERMEEYCEQSFRETGRWDSRLYDGRFPWPKCFSDEQIQAADKTISENSLPLKNVWCGVSVENRACKNRIDELRETPAAVRFLSLEPLLADLGKLNLSGIDWVIVGGESGPGARACNVAWVRSIVTQCKSAGVPCFVKQLGANVVSRNDAGFCRAAIRSYQGAPVRVLLGAKGGDAEKWPRDLRVREFPEAAPCAT